ncbi:keratin, type II cytoskeletal 1-like, partial [Bactrocera dorsalis]|uniref:Keratin, type II cytoskeletal 1-like n=1 Tax=Bactrocera dorsalis TaxID=27457 RepID=A0ABM3K8C9_BACDO
MNNGGFGDGGSEGSSFPKNNNSGGNGFDNCPQPSSDRSRSTKVSPFKLLTGLDMRVEKQIDLNEYIENEVIKELETERDQCIVIMDRQAVLTLNIRELQQALCELNISTTGRKADLPKRLLLHHGHETQEDDEIADSVSSYDDVPNANFTAAVAPIGRSVFTFNDIQESLTQFSGDDNIDIQQWINDFEENTLVVGWNSVQKFIYSKQLLKGAGKLFIRSQRGLVSWESLKEELISEFGKKVSSSEVHSQLRSRDDKRTLYGAGAEEFSTYGSVVAELEVDGLKFLQKFHITSETAIPYSVFIGTSVLDKVNINIKPEGAEFIERSNVEQEVEENRKEKRIELLKEFQELCLSAGEYSNDVVIQELINSYKSNERALADLLGQLVRGKNNSSPGYSRGRLGGSCGDGGRINNYGGPSMGPNGSGGGGGLDSWGVNAPNNWNQGGSSGSENMMSLTQRGGGMKMNNGGDGGMPQAGGMNDGYGGMQQSNNYIGMSGGNPCGYGGMSSNRGMNNGGFGDGGSEGSSFPKNNNSGGNGFDNCPQPSSDRSRSTKVSPFKLLTGLDMRVEKQIDLNEYIENEVIKELETERDQ